MEKHCRQVAIHAKMVWIGIFLSPFPPILAFEDDSSATTLLGYGLSGCLLLVAMMVLIARAVNSLTRKWGATEEASDSGWKLDAAFLALVASFFLAQFIVGVAIYHAFGSGAEFMAYIYLPAEFIASIYLLLGSIVVFSVVGICYKWVITQIYRCLLWAHFGAKRLASINLPRGNVSLLMPSPFLVEGSRRQINILELMPCVGIYLGGMAATYFVFTAAIHHEFDKNVFLMADLLNGTLLFLCGYALSFLYASANNAWHARFGDEEVGRLRFHLKQVIVICMLALLLFPAHIALVSASYFALGFKAGFFSVFSYFILLILLFHKKWVRAGLAGHLSRLDFAKRGAA